MTHTNKIFVFVTTNNMLHNSSNRAMILFKISALYKSFTYLLTYSSVMQNCSANIVPVSLSCVSVSQPVAKADQFIDLSLIHI